MLPNLYSNSLVSYIFHVVVGVFLLVNLLGNFLGLWLIDTGTRYVVLPSTLQVSPVLYLEVAFLDLLFKCRVLVSYLKA